MVMEYVGKKGAQESYLEAEEVHRLMSVASSLRDRLIVALMFECGIRRFELANIDIRGVQLNAKRIYIRRGKKGKIDGKNDEERRARYVFIKDQNILADLKAYVNQRISGKLIQSNNKLKDGINLSSINRVVAKLGKSAGLEPPHPNRKYIYPHLLRHSFGRREDMDIATKQKILGHRNPSMTLGFYGGLDAKGAQKRFMDTPHPWAKKEGVASQDGLEKNGVSTRKFCLHCGEKIIRIARFCEFCGGKQGES